MPGEALVWMCMPKAYSLKRQHREARAGIYIYSAHEKLEMRRHLNLVWPASTSLELHVNKH
jgi:hypothetical protein